MNPEERKALRKSKIAERDSLTEQERLSKSRIICEAIAGSPEFKAAKNIMIYKGTRGEVRLEALEKAPEAEGKKLLFPLCISGSEMISLLPRGEDAWKEGFCGIWEPVRERSAVIPPEEIDLVICPCTVFDENGGRMGMGAGFYDRYLEKCINAHVVSVAFEVQKTDKVPMAPWDKAMEKTFTEAAVYRNNK
ncbi:MAG: 5-formyltetrahydrofolate cyclo-ligase [Firmicutes bacterium]|nr:5-formyltetrahydrofolate cyclo-ligase [Bacillota bacterium]